VLGDLLGTLGFQSLKRSRSTFLSNVPTEMIVRSGHAGRGVRLPRAGAPVRHRRSPPPSGTRREVEGWTRGETVARGSLTTPTVSHGFCFLYVAPGVKSPPRRRWPLLWRWTAL